MRCTMTQTVVNIVAAVLILARPAAAQVDHSVAVSVGYFAVRGEDARIEGDVLVENLTPLAFELKRFNTAVAGAEWLVGLGSHVEVGVGVGFYQRTVPSTYRNFVNRDGSEIEQDLKLRMIPVTASVRVLPLGRRGSFQPYLGGGVGVFNWRYSEAGEFVDFSDFSVFRDRFVASGTATGPVVFGGARFPVGDRWAAAGELRFQRARGQVGMSRGFLADDIDLGGLTMQLSLQVRF